MTFYLSYPSTQKIIDFNKLFPWRKKSSSTWGVGSYLLVDCSCNRDSK